MFDATLLLLICLLPLAGALLVSVLGARSAGMARAAALVTMLAVLALAAHIFVGYAAARSGAFDLNLPWIAELGVHLHLAVDGLNLYLLLLTALLFPVALGCAWPSAEARRPLFLALLLLLEAGLLGTFLSQNLMFFFVCWEAVLIPMFVLILVFGGAKSREAAQAFFLYTLAGSVLLLAAVILLGVQCWQQTGSWSFELATLLDLQLGWGTQLFVFAAIVLACAIKCPLVPFHSWLPLTYAEAPPAGTALMAGALSKMGAFALLKLAIPLCPQAAAALAPWLIALAVFSILYGAVLALRQADFKLLVAYSSLSHMGYIVLGIFSFQQSALHGALLQTFSHGLAVAGLFLALGLLEQRRGAAYRQLTALATLAPRLAVVLMLFVLTSVALPLTSGFTGEFMILFGAFQQALAGWKAELGVLPLAAVILACSGMVLGAGYMLRFARTLLFGQAPEGSALPDLGGREALAFLPLLLLILAIGIAPAPFMARVQPDVAAVTARAAVPPFEKGGPGGISLRPAEANPPQSPFAKGGLEQLAAILGMSFPRQDNGESHAR
ncbi:NADH:ubiquinone oxidoreductase subunit M [Desulfuromonas versatilis]|uniref:NADH:ubiquinone oxidoreductase subunit M n=1 Tax=Desulfuromonas versatilis TaxID=2802975 RepID=A0ABN6E0D3_9BACT|nr:NADH-quinone oxidoreductase subunit M [Desulfuromonas versatilis]BCR05684.1 NADH:ubiquinone oxidoreductase subunit M [Desulfuromonas versatilis]